MAHFMETANNSINGRHLLKMFLRSLLTATRRESVLWLTYWWSRAWHIYFELQLSLSQSTILFFNLPTCQLLHFSKLAILPIKLNVPGSLESSHPCMKPKMWSYHQLGNNFSPRFNSLTQSCIISWSGMVFP